MRLLLTSAGITNRSIAKALKKLVKGKIRFAFIPSSANSLDGDKTWLIKNYNECLAIGSVDIVDVSAVGKGNWLPRLRKANVIVVGGGDTRHLMKCAIKSGLTKELPALLKSRIYVGISAGSIATAKRISASSDFLYNKNPNKAPSGFGYIDFNVRSHFNSEKAKDENLRKATKTLKGDLYALDDNSALLCINRKITVISEGKWKKY